VADSREYYEATGHRQKLDDVLIEQFHFERTVVQVPEQRAAPLAVIEPEQRPRPARPNNARWAPPVRQTEARRHCRLHVAMRLGKDDTVANEDLPFAS
jgi:hypothetical protein